MINPLPSVSLAYSLIVQDEKQREVAIQSHFPLNSASYLATNHKFVKTSDPRGRKTNLMCSHCKKPGHTVDKCYRIVGFPPVFKFARTKKPTGNVRRNATIIPREGSDELIQENFSGINQLSKKQFSQLI